MTKNNLSHLGKMSLIALFLFSLIVVSPNQRVEAQAEGQAQQQAYLTVSNYLAAWQRGDYKAMYMLWDVKSRNSVTADQLRNLLTVDITGSTEDEVRGRQLLGGASQILRSRIASVVSIQIHPQTNEYATADYTVQTTFQSLNGIAYASLLPDLLKQARANDARSKQSDSTLAVTVAAIGMSKPAVVSTQSNDFQVITHGQDARNKQGPYISLYIHQYTLVKEQGQWRISNAVTISEQPPVLPE